MAMLINMAMIKPAPDTVNLGSLFAFKQITNLELPLLCELRESRMEARNRAAEVDRIQAQMPFTSCCQTAESRTVQLEITTSIGVRQLMPAFGFVT